MTLEELIQQRIDRLENVPDTMLSVVDKESERLFKAALKRLGELETKDGKIVASRGNLAKINTILEDLKQVLQLKIWGVLYQNLKYTWKVSLRKV